MSFGGGLFGAGMDYGDLLPRMGQRVLAWLLAGAFVLFPTQTSAAMREWAEAKGKEMVEQVTEALSHSVSTAARTATTVPGTTTEQGRLAETVGKQVTVKGSNKDG